MEKKGELKKGAAHIEMILSFIIFISFLVFLLIIFRPLKLFSSSSSILDVTKTKILDYVSTNLSVTALYLNMSSLISLGECITLKHDVPYEKIIAKEENGTIIRGTAKNKNKILLIWSGKSFYRIYSSEELKERWFVIGPNCKPDSSFTKIVSGGSVTGMGAGGGGGGGGPGGGAGGSSDYSTYATGIAVNSKKVALSKLNAFFNNYTQNYKVFKDSLGLTNDFNVQILDNYGQVINNFKAGTYKPSSIEIMAKNIPIEILDENATITSAIMNLQVWD